MIQTLSSSTCDCLNYPALRNHPLERDIKTLYTLIVFGYGLAGKNSELRSSKESDLFLISA
jgi:hypothetical protein